VTAGGGLPIAGRVVPVAGLTILNSNDADWCRLHSDDYRARRAHRPSLIVEHSTGGNWPQRVIPGAGPRGHAEQIARMWSGQDRGGGERIHSGAQILIDYDGMVACLVDLILCAAYHAELANDHSIGIEHCTTPDGSIYQTTIDASVRLHQALCEPERLEDGLQIPFQIHAAPYRNAPLARCETGSGPTRHQIGGPDIVGVIGHRDETSERGCGDPGDAIYAALIAAGAEPLDYAAREDLERGRGRQRYLVGRGEPIAVDGIVGPVSLGAARRQGFRRWRDVPFT
jgi:hypothetical protein